MKHFFLLLIICLSSLQVYSTSTKSDSLVVPLGLNESPMKNNYVDTQSKSDQNPSSLTLVLPKSEEENTSWYNILALFVGIIGLASSIYSTYRASKVNERSNDLTSDLKKLEISMSDKSSQLANDLKKLEIKMRTSDIIVAKRLEVFPQLHVLTDTLGAAIRFYNNNISDEENKEWNTFVLKREIKDFHKKLSVWDANYCIFGGKKLTSKIGYVRKKLEKQNDWDKSEINQKDIEDLYIGLLNIEHQLKNEMKIHFTESVDNEGDEEITSIDY